MSKRGLGRIIIRFLVRSYLRIRGVGLLENLEGCGYGSIVGVLLPGTLNFIPDFACWQLSSHIVFWFWSGPECRHEMT